MKNSNKDLYKHLGWAIELLEGISDKFSSNKDIPKQVFLEMERIKKRYRFFACLYSTVLQCNVVIQFFQKLIKFTIFCV